MLRLGAARVGLVRHHAEQETPRHGHSHACMHIVLRGVYIEHSRAGTVAACPGDIVFKEPDVEHWNHFGSFGAESLRFELDQGGMPGGLGPCNDDALGFERALVLERSLRRITAGTRRLPHPHGIGLAVPGPGQLRASPQAELLFRLRGSFRKPIVLGNMAAELGLHRSHLTRQFTRDFGLSPQAYLTLKRSAWVAEQLALDARGLAALALEAGFADQSHCIRSFRRTFGTTPLRWNRAQRR